MQITLGNISQQNGRTVVTGGQSGLDTDSIIKALTEAKRLPAVALETKIETLGKQKSALNSLKSLLSRFRSAVDTLRNPPGVGAASKNIFEYRTSLLSTSTGADASAYMNVTVQPGAPIQGFTINEITTLAREAKQESSNFSLTDTTTASAVTANGSPEAGKFAAGSFSIRDVTGGADVSITLNEGDSLQTVVSKFNDVKSRTGIQANIVKVASGNPNNTYKIIFTGTKTGESYDFNMADAGTVTSDPDGVLGQLGFNTTQTAQNAQFTIDGVVIERESNAIDDVIDGIAFSLKQTTPAATTLSLSIAPDTQIVQNAVLAFADVYNEFRLFAASQQELGADGRPTEDAILSSDSTLRAVIASVSNEMTRVVAGLANGDPRQLADIGMKFDNFAGDEENPATKNILVVDSEKLAAAITANFDGVRGLFEYQMSSDNANLITFSRTNDLNVTGMSLNIDRTNNVYTATYTNAANQTVNVNLAYEITPTGVTLTGPADSGLAGLVMIYASADDATVNVNISQGIGDRLFNALDGVVKEGTGSLAVALDAIERQSVRNLEEIDKIDTSLETYRNKLIAQYSALEAALTRANQLLAMLQAQSDARANG